MIGRFALCEARGFRFNVEPESAAAHVAHSPTTTYQGFSRTSCSAVVNFGSMSTGMLAHFVERRLHFWPNDSELRP